MTSPAALSLSSNPLNTRADVESALHAILSPLGRYLSPGKARVTFGHTAAHFDASAADLEGYARRLWGAAPAGCGSVDDDSDLIDWGDYRTGLANGTDPTHPEFWGDPAKEYPDQRLVEMAPIGFALALIPDKIWYPLDAAAKRNVQAWLLQINDCVCANNNWHLFRVLVNLGLARVGAKHSIEAMHSGLDKAEEWYLGDGWYSDGVRAQRDYYVTFAIHFYCLIYAQLTSTSTSPVPELLHDPERAERYRARAAQIAPDMLHYFDPHTGACVPFGRSLTYRFACATFWGAMAFAGVHVEGSVSVAVAKGVWIRHLRWWFSRPEIFNGDGTLSIGWAYPNLMMAESYNSPDSPYWALKAFLPLALPPSHPFWSAPAAPLPTLPTPHPIPHAHAILVHSHRHRPHTYALASGQAATFASMRHSGEKYGKLAYSATFGFSVPVGAYGLEQVAPDCTLALSDDADVLDGNGCHWRVRRVPKDARMIRSEGEGGEGRRFEVGVVAGWDAWRDVDVRTWVVPMSAGGASCEGEWHFRVHRIVTARTIWACDAGFSTSGVRSDGGGRRLAAWDDVLDEGVLLSQGDGMTGASALVRSSTGTTGMRAVSWSHNQPKPGRDGSGPGTGPQLQVQARIINCAPNSSIMFPKSLLPTLNAELVPRAEPYWLVSGVFAIAGHDVDNGGWRRAWEEEIVVPDWLVRLLE